MKNVLRSAAAALVALASATSVQAQTISGVAVSRGQFEIIPYTGYLLSERLMDGPLGAELGGANAAVYGVQVGMPLNPYAAILGGVARSSGDLRAGVPILGGIAVGRSRTTLYDLAVQVRFAGNDGARRGAVPFAQLGAGAAQRELSSLGLSAKSTDFVVSGGAGIDVAVTPGASFRLMLKDYYGPADFGSLGPINARADDLHTLALTAGVRLTF